MIKRTLIGFVLFVSGFGVAIFTDSFFRRLIQDLFQITTNDGIQFSGKDFYLFGNPIYPISFGLVFLIFGVAHNKVEKLKIVRNGILMILTFGILLIGFCSLDANLKIIECTTCDDGIRRLGYNEINYGLILAISSVFSSIQSLILIKKNRKNPVYNNV